MKTPFLAILLSVAAVSGAAKPEPVVATRTIPAGKGAFKVGAERKVVLSVVGLPDERIGDYIWIYRDCRLGDLPTAKGCDTLVVAFRKDRVIAMKLTDGAALRELLAQNNVKTTGPSYADLLK